MSSVSTPRVTTISERRELCISDHVYVAVSSGDSSLHPRPATSMSLNTVSVGPTEVTVNSLEAKFPESMTLRMEDSASGDSL